MAEPDQEDDDKQVWSTDQSASWGIERFGAYSGQSYINPEEGFRMLLSLLNSDQVHPNFGAGSYDESSKIAELLAERTKLAGNARGFIRRPDFSPVVTVANVSEIAVMIVGEDPSNYMAAGGGFTEDGRHDEHMSTLREVFEVEDDGE